MLVVMAAGTALAVMLVVMAAGTALVVMLLVMITGTYMVVVLLMNSFSGANHHFTFYGAGKGSQLRQQGIRVFRGQAKLLGGEGDGGFLHLFMGVEFGFDLGGAVGAVQIFDEVDFLCHGDSSF